MRRGAEAWGGRSGELAPSSEVVYGIIHDLRNPLTVVSGTLQFVQQFWGSMPEDEKLDSVQQALHGVARLDELLSSLLDGNGAEAHDRPFDLGPMIREVAADFDATGRGVDVEAPEALCVVADPDIQRRILENLVSNAMKYSPGHAPVTISAKMHRTKVVVSVRDLGPGIAGTETTRLFRPFSKPDHEASGAGLGLFVVKSLVELEGGRLQVDSEPGRGSTFSYTVPRRA